MAFFDDCIKIKVSVIVPVYNVEKYLHEALNSLINQTLKDIEFICINDGSTDSSAQILEEYQNKDSRFKIITTSNKGYGHAMNIGLQASNGEYVGILEPDDYVDIAMYEKLYNIAKLNEADIVKADFYRFYGKGELQDNRYNMIALNSENYNRIINPEKEKECFRFLMNTWAGIYNRKFLISNNILHSETPGAAYQDNGFWFKGFCFAKRIYFVNEPLYYNRRDNPNSSVYDKSKVYECNYEYDMIRDFLKENKELEKNFLHQYCMKRYDSYWFTLNRIGWKDKEKYIYLMSKELAYMKKSGEMVSDPFFDHEWAIINKIIDSPNDFWNEYIENNVDYYKYCISEIRNSKSYKIGMAITWLPRKMKDLKEVFRNGFREV